MIEPAKSLEIRAVQLMPGEARRYGPLLWALLSSVALRGQARRLERARYHVPHGRHRGPRGGTLSYPPDNGGNVSTGTSINTADSVNLSDGDRRVTKTSETVAQNIVHDIMARGLKTGDRLPLEGAMLQEYRVSRASLREALRLLEVQGLISLKPGPGGGPLVGSVEAGYLARTASLYFHLGGMRYNEIFSTQEILEPDCAKLAAEHPDRADRMRPFYDAKSMPLEGLPYYNKTRDFHVAIYELAGNGVLTLLTRAITNIVSTHFVSTTDPVDLHEPINEEHAELARAIGGGQAVKAHRLMGEHFRRQHDWYRERWPAKYFELIEWR
jgi:GntR family transcriptional repressor for pyruvate dehydrogenase complex